MKRTSDPGWSPSQRPGSAVVAHPAIESLGYYASGFRAGQVHENIRAILGGRHISGRDRRSVHILQSRAWVTLWV